MAKFLLLIAVIIIVYLFFRVMRGTGRTPQAQRPASHRDGPGEDMVRCKVCGVHLPRSESVTSRGEFFCSQEHLRLADRGQQGH